MEPRTYHVAVGVHKAMAMLEMGNNLFDAPESEVLYALSGALNEGHDYYTGCGNVDETGKCKGHPANTL